MICLKCGNENQKESIFCNKCGIKLQIEDNQDEFIKEGQLKKELQEDSKTLDEMLKDNTLKSLIKNKKISILISIIAIMVISYLLIKPPIADTVYQKIKDYDSEDSIAHLNEVYPEDGGFLGLFEEKNKKNKIEVIGLLIEDIDKNIERQFGGSISDYNSVSISKVEIKDRRYNSDYVDIDITVNNDGEKSVRYIKINLFFKDTSGEIIKSNWTNDNAIIKPGASQVITKMVKQDGWRSVSAEIADIKW